MTSPDPLAVGAMVAYCGWDPTETIAAATVTLDGNGTPLLALPSLHVTGVASVAVEDAWGTVHTYLSTDSPATIGPGYTMVGWSDNGILTCKDPCLGCIWPEDEGNVTVTFASGYGWVPEDLAAALDHLSARIPTVSGATSARLGSGALTFGPAVAAGGMLLIEQMVFDRYRIPRVR